MSYNVGTTGLNSTPDFFSATVTVIDDYGLHARPAANLVRTAASFQSKITLSTGEAEADAKSILDILALGATQNTRLTLECRGIDAALAGEALVQLFQLKAGDTDAGAGAS